MYTDSENPPVAKLPFVLGDLALLATAGLLAWASPRPWDAAALLGIFACVALGAVLLAVPFLLDYSHRQERLADERQAAINHLVKTAAAAAEQASIAATSLHTLARDAAESMAGTKQQSPAPEVRDYRPELHALREQVATLAKQLSSTPGRVSPVELPPAFQQRLDELAAGLSALQAALSRASPSPPVPASSPPAGSEPSEARAAAPPEARKTRRGTGKRAGTGDTPPLFAEGLLNADVTLSEGDAEPLAPVPAASPAASVTPEDRAASGEKEPAPSPPPTPPESATPKPSTVVPKPRAVKVSSAPSSVVDPTRLTVTAYIGIGNKLFLRGEGPGLTPTAGVPLQFVSIGKWRWESDSATEPVKVSVWKNDEQRCDALGDFELAPGQEHEVTADF